MEWMNKSDNNCLGCNTGAQCECICNINKTVPTNFRVFSFCSVLWMNCYFMNCSGSNVFEHGLKTVRRPFEGDMLVSGCEESLESRHSMQSV
jgi:hypothetical protein